MRTVFKASLLILSMLWSYDASAQSVSLVASYGDWSVYTFKEDRGKVCYAMSPATEIRGQYNRQGKTHLLVTHRPKNKSFNVVSYVPGYVFKPNKRTWLEIEKDRFYLSSKKDKAWALESDADEKIVRKMQKSDLLYVVGTTLEDKRTLDKFSLTGFSKAIRKASALCGKK